MKKKTLCLAACVAAVVLLVGCAGDSAPAPAAEVEVAAGSSTPWCPSEDQKTALISFTGDALDDEIFVNAAFVDDFVLSVSLSINEPAEHVLPDVLREFSEAVGRAAAEAGKPSSTDLYIEFVWADGMRWQEIAAGGDLS